MNERGYPIEVGLYRDRLDALNVAAGYRNLGYRARVFRNFISSIPFNWIVRRSRESRKKARA